RSAGSTCTCGKYPITQVCLMEHQENKARLEVGNCCVQKFFGEDYSPEFERQIQYVKNGSNALKEKMSEFDGTHKANKEIINSLQARQETWGSFMKSLEDAGIGVLTDEELTK
ncbi:hypothetical protein KKA95_04850, partial [Patescibacteria group bacterium]|nr:hypothetical protein [Patescibacteria group bacterium]